MTKTVEFDKVQSDEIVALRNEDKKWREISDIVGIPTGKCMLMFDAATVKAKDKIKGATPDDIARLRDKENLSWGSIAARCSIPESAARSMYTEKTGRDSVGLRIGKGGRHPGSGGGTTTVKKSAAKKVAAKKGTAKKTAAPAKKAAAAPANPLAGLDKAAITERLTRHAVVHDGETVRVKSVKSVTANAIVVTDETGSARTLKRVNISKVSAKPVMVAA